GEDAAQALLVEARGQADVRDREAGGERVLAAVETPRARVEAEPLDERARERLLGLDGERTLERLVGTALAHRADERDELALQMLENPLRLGGRQPVLVLVEEDVIRVVVGLEARDVAPLELELPLDVRPEDLEVAPLARLEPGAEPERAAARQLRAQLGRDAPRPLALAAEEADQARVVRLVRD